jgi:hypothetical protein
VDDEAGHSMARIPRNRELDLPSPNGDGSDISAAGSVGALGQRFRVAATGLWAGGVVAFALVFAVASMSSFPEQRDMMWLLGVAMGGLLGTAVMHGRLADNRAELFRVQAELAREANEYSKLLSKVLRTPLSSKRRKADSKKEIRP